MRRGHELRRKKLISVAFNFADARSLPFLYFVSYALVWLYFLVGGWFSVMLLVAASTVGDGTSLS